MGSMYTVYIIHSTYCGEAKSKLCIQCTLFIVPTVVKQKVNFYQDQCEMDYLQC